MVAPGKGDFHLTGQLGEVMQESVTAAWGYLKTAIARDDRLWRLWDVSPGRAYLLDHYSARSADPARGDARPSGRDRVASWKPRCAVGDRESQEGDPASASRAAFDHELLSALEVRIHLPEGAVPKEGPSAGIAVAASLLSALVPVRR